MFKSPANRNDINSPHLQKLFEYWDGLRNGRVMPCRRDFCPTALPSVLPYISMVDVERSPRRYKCRLLGTETVKALGKDVTGKYLHEVPEVALLGERFDWVVDNKASYTNSSHMNWSEKTFLAYEAVGLPLSQHGDDVDIIMYGTVYNLQDNNKPF